MNAEELLKNAGMVLVFKDSQWNYYGFRQTWPSYIGKVGIYSKHAELYKDIELSNGKLIPKNLAVYWLVTPFDYCYFSNDLNAFVKRYKELLVEQKKNNIDKDFV